MNDIFDCKQCGKCCIDLVGAYQSDCPDEDWFRWKREKRYNILKRIQEIKVQGKVVGRDMWFSLTKSGHQADMVNRCPWLRKKGDIYICLIHTTKPTKCRNFVPAPSLAEKIGCRGWEEG